MSDERTRTTKEVRDGYAYDGYSGDVDPYYELRFDRWLLAHDAEIRTAALEEAAGIAEGELFWDPRGEVLSSDEVAYNVACREVSRAIRAAKEGAQ